MNNLSGFYLLLLSLFFFQCGNSQSPGPLKTVISSEAAKTENKSRSPLLVSFDTGKTWEPAGEGLPPDTEGSFLADYLGAILFASDNNGLFLSDENYSNWKSIGETLPGKKINALFTFQNQILVGVFNQGIFQSNDEGKTWKELNFDIPDKRIQAIYKNGDYMLVGTDSGIYKLLKGSKQWEAVFTGPQIVSLNEHNGLFLAGSSQGSLIGTESGEAWEWAHREGAAHYTEILNNRFVIMNVSGDLFISENFGREWTKANYFPYQGSYVYDVAMHGDYMVFSNNYGIHQSRDGGKNWTLIYPEETWGMFEFLLKDGAIYGSTRTWKEYREKSK